MIGSDFLFSFTRHFTIVFIFFEAMEAKVGPDFRLESSRNISLYFFVYTAVHHYPAVDLSSHLTSMVEALSMLLLLTTCLLVFQDPSVTQVTNSNIEPVDQYNPFQTVRFIFFSSSTCCVFQAPQPPASSSHSCSPSNFSGRSSHSYQPSFDYSISASCATAIYRT